MLWCLWCVCVCCRWLPLHALCGSVLLPGCRVLVPLRRHLGHSVTGAADRVTYGVITAAVGLPEPEQRTGSRTTRYSSGSRSSGPVHVRGHYSCWRRVGMVRIRPVIRDFVNSVCVCGFVALGCDVCVCMCAGARKQTTKQPTNQPNKTNKTPFLPP